MAHFPLSTENVGFAPASARFEGINKSGKLPGKPGAGRPKGSVNQFTADVKSMILGALHDAGGRDYLHKQAIANPTAFMGLVGKVLPTTLVGDPKRPIVVSVSEEERRREVDAALDAVFGAYTETKLVDTRAHTVHTEPVYTQDAVHTIEHEDTRRPGQGDVKLPAELHEAETASATSEPQAADNAESDDKIVRLSHIKSHTAG